MKKTRTKKQETASERNWTKARLLGARNLFTTGKWAGFEKDIVPSIIQSIDRILHEFDDTSEKHLHLQTTRQCRFCMRGTRNKRRICKRCLPNLKALNNNV